MFTIFAHAGEAHTTAVETTTHSLDWFIQLPLFIIVITLVASIVWFTTKKQDITLLITAFVMLIAGFGLFKVAPLVSVLAITLGLVLTLLLTLFGLSDTSSKSTENK